jgi:hypothetical protein
VQAPQISAPQVTAPAAAAQPSLPEPIRWADLPARQLPGGFLGYGQDFDGDGRISFQEAMMDMQDGGGRGQAGDRFVGPMLATQALNLLGVSPNPEGVVPEPSFPTVTGGGDGDNRPQFPLVPAAPTPAPPVVAPPAPPVPQPPAVPLSGQPVAMNYLNQGNIAVAPQSMFSFEDYISRLPQFAEYVPPTVTPIGGGMPAVLPIAPQPAPLDLGGLFNQPYGNMPAQPVQQYAPPGQQPQKAISQGQGITALSAVPSVIGNMLFG